MKPERNNSGGTRVVLFGSWFVLVVMASLTLQPYVQKDPFLAWSMVIVGSVVLVVGIVFALGLIKRRGKSPEVFGQSG